MFLLLFICVQPCLSKGGKTLFMVHISPDAASAYESLTSLRFATKVAGTELGQATKKASSTSTTAALAAYMPPVQQRQPTTAAQTALPLTGAAQLLNFGQQFAQQHLLKQGAMTTGKVRSSAACTLPQTNNANVALKPTDQGNVSTVTNRTLLYELDGAAVVGIPQQIRLPSDLTDAAMPKHAHAIPQQQQQQQQEVEAASLASISFTEGRQTAMTTGASASEAIDLRAALRRKRQLATSGNNDTTAQQQDAGPGQGTGPGLFSSQPPQKKAKTSKGAWY